MEAVIGVVTALNFILIIWKFSTPNRKFDAVLDLGIFIFLCGLFSTAGQGGLYVGMVASFVVSIYLLFNAPKLSWRPL